MITIQLDVKNKPCLCIGGGAVAERRITTLLREGAAITVMSPTVTKKIAEWSAEGKLVWIPTTASPEQITDAFLVLAMTDNDRVNEEIAEAARAKGALVNRADKNGDCDFTFPAVTEVGMIRATIATGKASPRINRLLRMDFTERYEPLSKTLPALKAYREEVRHILKTSEERETFWQTHLTKQALQQILEGHWHIVEESIKRAISSIRD